MILGDDDRHLTERERPLPNAGREAATEAAKAVGGIAAFPAFKQGPNAERTDFNDLQKTEGVKTVEIQLARRCADGVEGQALHPVGIGPYRRDHQPAVEEEIRPLHQ